MQLKFKICKLKLMAVKLIVVFYEYYTRCGSTNAKQVYLQVIRMVYKYILDK